MSYLTRTAFSRPVEGQLMLSFPDLSMWHSARDSLRAFWGVHFNDLSEVS